MYNIQQVTSFNKNEIPALQPEMFSTWIQNVNLRVEKTYEREL